MIFRRHSHRASTAQELDRFTCKRPSNFQQLTYPKRIGHPDRSEGSLFTSFQRLTNCLKSPTLSEPLCFQSLPTIKSSKPFVFITIQIDRGRVYPQSSADLKFYFKFLPWCSPSPRPLRENPPALAKS